MSIRAYGAVYRGVQKGSGNVFAIKVITALGNAEQKEELEKEIEILKNASHKNIVTYYGSLTADDAFWVCAFSLASEPVRSQARASMRSRTSV
jgi:serine/threonine protein kinase